VRQLAGDAPAYRLVRDVAKLAIVARACDDSKRIGLDTETTSLDPRKDRARLLHLLGQLDRAALYGHAERWLVRGAEQLAPGAEQPTPQEGERR
jgi:hypothetical protein